MTRQQAFEIMVKSLFEQGCRSIELIDGQINCRYRGPNNTKCAVGFLIPDDKYYPAMEGEPGSDFTELIGLEGIESDRFLNFMQNVHDIYEPHDWKRRFIEVAEHYNLNYSFINDLTLNSSPMEN